MGRNVKELHPRLQEKVAQLQILCAKENLLLGIGECFRTAAEQNELYAQGRTKAGAIITNAPGSSYSSQHQWGIAFDFFKNVRGHEYDDNAFFTRVSQLGKSIGLGWGGDWHSIVDKPHLYLPDWGSGTGILKSTYGTFESFKKTWGKASITPIKPAQSAVEPPWKATGTATCGGDGVRVRMIPNGNVILQLNKGQRFEIDGKTSGSWTHVKVQSVIGWMATQYVVPDKPAPAANPTAQPAAPVTGNPIIRDGQIHCNNFCNAGLKVDGFRGPATVKGSVMVLQQAVNLDYGAGLKIDGLPGSKTDAALRGHTVRIGESQEMVRALQILLMLNGYDPKGVDGNFGAGCDAAVRQYQREHGLTVDGIAGVNTFMSLIA